MGPTHSLSHSLTHSPLPCRSIDLTRQLLSFFTHSLPSFLHSLPSLLSHSVHSLTHSLTHSLSLTRLLLSALSPTKKTPPHPAPPAGPTRHYPLPMQHCNDDATPRHLARPGTRPRAPDGPQRTTTPHHTEKTERKDPWDVENGPRAMSVINAIRASGEKRAWLPRAPEGALRGGSKGTFFPPSPFFCSKIRLPRVLGTHSPAGSHGLSRHGTRTACCRGQVGALVDLDNRVTMAQVDPHLAKLRQFMQQLFRERAQLRTQTPLQPRVAPPDDPLTQKRRDTLKYIQYVVFVALRCCVLWRMRGIRKMAHLASRSLCSFSLDLDRFVFLCMNLIAFPAVINYRRRT